MATKKKQETKAEAVAEPKYTKEQLLASKHCAANYDVVNTALEDGKDYTIAEAKAAVEDFLKMEVL